MGHGKETPRQKMIGMMYLVLTAMLALNVSAEVLDAFRLVNEGIRSTTENFSQKNTSVYKEFEKEVAKNEQKAKPWQDKAFEVRERADSMYQYIQDLKVRILKANQGENIQENAALHQTEDGQIVIEMDKVKGDDKTDVSDRIMVGKDFNGEAYTLKKRVSDFREFLLGFVDEEDAFIQEPDP